jgi:hypothetical protein
MPPNIVPIPRFKVGDDVVHSTYGRCTVGSVKFFFGDANYYLTPKQGNEPFWSFEEFLTEVPKSRAWDEEDV